MYKSENVKIYICGQEVKGFADEATMFTDINAALCANTAVKPPERIKTKQVEIHYDVIGAGPVGHPELIFKKICQQQRWDMLEAVPYGAGDCWIFKVQMYDDSHSGYLPSYIEILEEKDEN